MTGHSKSPHADTPPTCGACPAFDNNLCRALTQAILAKPLQGEVQDHTAMARRTIWRQGDTVDRVPVICQGWAAASLALSDGRRQILTFLLPGDLVSAALIFDAASPCAIEAVTDVRYRMFPRPFLKQALCRQSDLLVALSRVWSDETVRADRLAIDLGRCGAAERIASLIINLSERLRARGMLKNETMDFPLRQHHIADAAGLTVVHVGNVLAEFRRAGLLEINDRSLTIIDLAGLRRVAETP